MDVIWNYLAANWLLLLGGTILGFSVGMLTGLFGAGGGFIITPALNIFLGLPMNLAVGTSACQVLGASGFSLYHHLDRNMYGIRIAMLMAIGILPGVITGKFVVGYFKGLGMITIAGKDVLLLDFVLLVVFAVFLSLIAGWLFFDNFWLRRHRHDDDDHTGYLASLKIPPVFQFRTIPSGPFSIPVLVVLGFVMGFLSGLLGIGGGVVMMPILFYLVGQETKFATQTSMMLVFIAGFLTTVSYAFSGDVKYVLAVFMVTGAFFGAKPGAAINKAISGKSLRKYFAFVVLAAVIMVLVKIIMMLNGD